MVLRILRVGGLLAVVSAGLAAPWNDPSAHPSTTGGASLAGTGVGGPEFCQWAEDELGAGGLDGPSYATAVFDDGSAPALYVGGQFRGADGQPIDGVARWDGSGWSAVADFSGDVEALAVYDEGSGPRLFSVGAALRDGGQFFNGIARWDGVSWTAVGGGPFPGLSGFGRTLAVYDDGSGPALYAGGVFQEAGGGVPVSNVARWDGAAWEAVGELDDEVSTLAVYNDGTGPALFAGGRFTQSGAGPVERLARWDGAEWQPVGNLASGFGLDGPAAALQVWDDGGGPALIVGGSFTQAGSVTANHIARWDGTSFSRLGEPSSNGTDDRIETLAAFGGDLFAGGWFATAGGVPAAGIARWDGAAWSALAGPGGQGTTGPVTALGVHDEGSGPCLVVGGEFSAAGGVASNGIARWQGGWSAWSPGSADGRIGPVFALATLDSGAGPELVAAGLFSHADGQEVGNLARWDGGGWKALPGPAGVGVDGETFVLEASGAGSEIYAGGDFVHAGGLPVHGVAHWDGTAWSPLSGPSGTGVAGGFVSALAVWDDGGGPALYAGGSFDSAGGLPISYLARWDGAGWSPVLGSGGQGVDGTVWALEVHDDGGGPALYAGGAFSTADGLTVNGVARWDGTDWAALTGPGGTGVSPAFVRALEEHDEGLGPVLFVGGIFGTAGGVPAFGIARWDGSDWSAVADAGGSQPFFNSISSLASHDDRRGPALFVGGDSGSGSLNLARWDGSDWSYPRGPQATDLDWYVAALESLGTDLFAGGGFRRAGGVPSAGVARWACDGIFADGFESGDLSAWSGAVGALRPVPPGVTLTPTRALE